MHVTAAFTVEGMEDIVKILTMCYPHKSNKFSAFLPKDVKGLRGYCSSHLLSALHAKVTAKTQVIKKEYGFSYLTVPSSEIRKGPQHFLRFVDFSMDFHGIIRADFILTIFSYDPVFCINKIHFNLLLNNIAIDGVKSLKRIDVLWQNADIPMNLNFPRWDNFSQRPGQYLNSLKPKELIAMAMVISPRHEFNFQEHALPDLARQLCVSKGYLTVEEAEYLSSEFNFLTGASFDDLESTWQ